MSGKGVQAMIATKRGDTATSVGVPGPFVSKPKFDAFFRALAGVLESEGGTWRIATAKLAHFFDQGKKPTGDELRLWIDHLVRVHDIPDHFFAYWQMRCGRNKARVHETTTGAAMVEDLEALYVEENMTLKARLSDEETRRREAEEARDAARENVSAQHKTIEALREKADAAERGAAEASVRAARPILDSAEVKRLRDELEALRATHERLEKSYEQVYKQRGKLNDELDSCKCHLTDAEERELLAVGELAKLRDRMAEMQAAGGTASMSDAEILRRAGEIGKRFAAAAEMLGSLGG